MIEVLIAVLSCIFGFVTMAMMVIGVGGIIKVKDGEWQTVKRLSADGIDVAGYVAAKIKNNENMARALRYLTVRGYLATKELSGAEAAEILNGPLGKKGPVFDDRKFLNMDNDAIMKELGLNGKS